MTCGLDWEGRFWADGYATVCGVDEVGRGALAGPLVAAAVVFPAGYRPSVELAQVRDSKALTGDVRLALSARIAAEASALSLGWVPAEEIDEIGLGPANRLAMLRALDGLAAEPEALLVDAVTLDVSLPQVGLIDGDASCFSIAAASIVAKVARDGAMCAEAERFPRYGFERHVGYGTARHLAALRVHGPCELHRRSFAPVAACGGIDVPTDAGRRDRAR